MTFRIAIISLSIFVIAMISFGCGSDHHSNGMMSNNGSSFSSAISKVYPADGATNVLTSSTIAIKFNRKMDSTSVMDNLHLMDGDAMREWMDSSTQHGGMGHMSTRDMDHMMSWMDSISIHGLFSWNDTMDSCEFIPSSGMSANSEHMLFMYEGGMMDHNGGMMGSNDANNKYRFYHFMTK